MSICYDSVITLRKICQLLFNYKFIPCRQIEKMIKKETQD